MDYASFVRLRAPLWDGFAAGLGEARQRLGHQDLEDLAIGYRQVLHDHALAAARYPGTSAARRLRRLALEGTRALVQERGERRLSLLRFFFHTFPEAFRRLLPTIGVAAALFLATAFFGLVVSLVSPGTGVVFIGPGALEGLERGQLWTEPLTSSFPPGFTSSAIATNNLSVALTAWAGGALAGLGSLYVLVLNGFMLGSIIGVTLHYSMQGELFEFIAAHGPLELTLIVIASAGGLALGRAMVAAEDRPRAVVLREASRDALALLGGSLPWLALLALVEAFVSPSPDLPPALKAAAGVALLALYLALAGRRLLAARSGGG